jgi:hypothetical protein
MSAVVPYTRSPDAPVALEARHRWIVLLGEAASLAHAIANTDFVPSGMRGNEAAIAAAILYGDEVGLGPMQSLAKVSVIDGRPTLAAESQRALILAAGHSVWFDPEPTVTRATAVGVRADNGVKQSITWTLDDAKRAGIDGRRNWRTYPRAMLVARASAELARAIFADVIGGLAAIEEIEDLDGSSPVEPPSATPPAEEEKTTTRRRRTTSRTAPVVAPQVTPVTEPPEPPLPEDESPAEHAAKQPQASQPQLRKLMAMFRERGVTDRDERLDWTNAHLDRTVVTASELTDVEASRLIDALEQVPPGETGSADSTSAEDVSSDATPARPEAASTHGASGPAGLDEAAIEGQLDLGKSDDPPITSGRLDMLMWSIREAGVNQAWLHGKLAELGMADMPKKIGKEDLKRLTRSEAIKLSDALSSEIDARLGD